MYTPHYSGMWCRLALWHACRLGLLFHCFPGLLLDNNERDLQNVGKLSPDYMACCPRSRCCENLKSHTEAEFNDTFLLLCFVLLPRPEWWAGKWEIWHSDKIILISKRNFITYKFQRRILCFLLSALEDAQNQEKKCEGGTEREERFNLHLKLKYDQVFCLTPSWSLYPLLFSYKRYLLILLLAQASYPLLHDVRYAIIGPPPADVSIISY